MSLALPALSTADIMLLLHAARLDSAVKSTDALPIVRLGLRSGRVLDARLLNISKPSDMDRSSILWETSSATKAPTLLYIRAIDVEFVALAKTEANERLLSYGKMRRETPPPTRLDLGRRLSKMASEISTALGVAWKIDIDWNHFTDPSPENLSYLGSVVQDLELLFPEILKDEMGRAALREKVAALVILSGKQQKVVLASRILSLELSAEGGLIQVPSYKELESLILNLF